MIILVRDKPLALNEDLELWMAGIRKTLEAVCRLHDGRDNSGFAVRAALLATTTNLSASKRIGPFNTAKIRFGMAGQD